MNKRSIFIISGLIAMGLTYIVYNLFLDARYSYSIEMKDYKPYMWFFKDSIKQDVDTSVFIGCIRKTDAIYSYHYKSGHNNARVYSYEHFYHITIWDIKDLDVAELKNTYIHKDVNLDKLSLSPGEILNSKSYPKTTVKYGPFLYGTMSVDLDYLSKIDSTIEMPNYKGFYGSIHRIAFKDRFGKYVAMIDYGKSEKPLLFLLCKINRGFYVITIESDDFPMRKDIINILNI